MSRREIEFINPDEKLVEAKFSPTGRRYANARIGPCPFCSWPSGTLFLQEELTVNPRSGHEVYTETAAQIRCPRCGGSTGVARQIRSKSGKNDFDLAVLAPDVMAIWNYRHL